MAVKSYFKFDHAFLYIQPWGLSNREFRNIIPESALKCKPGNKTVPALFPARPAPLAPVFARSDNFEKIFPGNI